MKNIFKNKLLSLAILSCFLVPSMALAVTPDVKSFDFIMNQNWYRTDSSYKHVPGDVDNGNSKGAYVINTLNQGNPYNIVHHMINSDGQWRSVGRTHHRNARTSYANWGQQSYRYRLEMRIPEAQFGLSARTRGTWASDNRDGN